MNPRRQPSLLMFRNQYLEGTSQVCERALGDRKKKGFHKYNHRLNSWIDERKENFIVKFHFYDLIITEVNETIPVSSKIKTQY